MSTTVDAYDHRAERAVLGAMLRPDASIDDLAAACDLEPADFSSGTGNRSIFEAVRGLYTIGADVTVAAVNGWIDTNGGRAAVGPALVETIANETATAANLGVHVRALVALRAERREADGGADGLDALDVGAILPPLLDSLERPLRRMPSRWPRLDRFMSDERGAAGGFVTPSLVLVGAEPKSGKTTMAQITAERHAAAGGFVYYLDEENGRQRFWRRALSRRAKLGGARVGDVLALDEHERRQEARAWAMGMAGRFFYDDTRRVQNGLELRARVLSLRDRIGDGDLLVVVDSLQKLPLEDMSQRRAGVDTWLRQIEALRDDAGAVVLMISELARSQAKPGNAGSYSGRPRLKESGDAEYTADVVLMLTRAAEGDAGDVAAWGRPGASWRGPAFNLSIDYNRDGTTGDVASYRSVFPFYDVEEGDFVTKTSGADKRRSSSPSPQPDRRLPAERDDDGLGGFIG